MMQHQQENTSNSILKQLSPSKVIIPIVIGLVVTAYLIYRDLTQQDLSSILVTPDLFWLGMALLVLVFRDLFYIYRIRYLTDRALSWKGSFYTIILWEFSSALSPSAVGGTAVASFLLLKEGISFGKSLAYVLVSAILDNMYFIIFGGIVLLVNYFDLFSAGSIFYFEDTNPGFAATLRYLFYIGYGVITLYTLLMMYGLFVKPVFIKWLFVRITSIRWLKRWQRSAVKQGDELVLASGELKGKGASYWSRAVISTILIWTSRYFIVNCLISAFAYLSPDEHMFVLSRHVILWVVLLIGITPGASGIAEIAFKGFFIQFAGGLAGIIAILWRMVTYYPYLILGAVFLPRWIRRVFFRKGDSDESDRREMPIQSSE
ncbi:MAG: flippase-like domain-containing protein [Bacteroidia bacterium]|nr:flippase-like domain-containing protein [Bacteroidia bacterium]